MIDTAPHLKTYVLDTSVLLSSPRALFTFEEHEVVIPLVVLKELEKKRTDPVIGWQARTALRTLEDLAEQVGNDITTGMTATRQGGMVRVEMNHVDDSGLDKAFRDGSNDTRILAVAKNLQAEGNHVVLVSQDLPLRLLAQVAGLSAEPYRHDQVESERAYTGIEEIYVAKEVIDGLYHSHCAVLPEVAGHPVHTGLVLSDGGSSSALARITDSATGQVELISGNLQAWGVSGRSAEQRIALANLLDPQIPIVSLGGPAGTGKSFLAIAAGLEAVLEQREQKRVVVFRNMHAVGGEELGFLPGSEAEKMAPWAAAVFDALKGICEENTLEEIAEQGLLEVLPLTHIRGRTFTDTYIVIDEAQNLDRSVLLTALSRLGENSRAILSWDVAQRDNLRVGRYDGIAAVVEKLKGQHLFSHTTLVKSERSAAAAMIAELLDDGS